VSLSAPRFVRVKTSARVRGLRASHRVGDVGFSVCSTGYTQCATDGAGDDTRATCAGIAPAKATGA
jgi:hypothetical protein